MIGNHFRGKGSRMRSIRPTMDDTVDEVGMKQPERMLRVHWCICGFDGEGTSGDVTSGLLPLKGRQKVEESSDVAARALEGANKA